jgi:3-methyladenine DNA glycosylase/8-oxoguanine DNA glycosylase
MSMLGTLALRGPAGEPVDFRRLLHSHGVATLAPNTIDLDRCVFETTIQLDGGAVGVRIVEDQSATLRVDSTTAVRGVNAKQEILDIARHILRLDEDLSGFYARAAKDRRLSWVTAGAGRMLRSQTVFEDVVKTICTTNCSWSATVRMTEAIVGGLGAVAADGRRAFPSPAAMATAPPTFYSDVARAGYRGAYLQRLAIAVAEGRLDLEQLADPALPDGEVEQRLLALPGVGRYAASHVMLIGLGRYRRLILDSWTRPKYARLQGRKAADDVIERRFRRYGEYAGLAFWMMLTQDWVEEEL